MAFSCSQCGAAISAGQIDFSKKMAACGLCGLIAPLGAAVGEGIAAKMPPDLPWEETVSAGVATIVVRTPVPRGYAKATIALVLALVGAGGFVHFTWYAGVLVLLVAIVFGIAAYSELTAFTLLRFTVKGVFAKRRLSDERLKLDSPPIVFRAEPAPEEIRFVAADTPNAPEIEVRTIPWWTVRVETADGSVRALPLRVESESLAHHAAARLNEILRILSTPQVAGYRVAPKVASLPPADSDDEEELRRRGR